MDNPLITTVIPTFRRPQLLKRAIESVLRQTYENFRVVVCDNASGDETTEIVNRFAEKDHRIQYYCHQENLGANANFNFGLSKVHTPYFSFLSDDDLLLPNFYETTLSGFRMCPEAGFVAGSVIVMTSSGGVLSVPLDMWPKEGVFMPPEGLLYLIDNKLPVWTSILFRKAVTDNLGGVDRSVGAGSDFDFQLRAAIQAPFVITKSPCGIFVSHSDSYSADISLSVFWPGWKILTDKIVNHTEIPQKIRNKARLGLARYIRVILFSLGLKLIYNGKFSEAHLTAKTLRSDYGEITRSAAVTSIAMFCSSGKTVHRIFIFLYEQAWTLRKKLARSSRHLQAHYGEHAQWL